jgi:hypothetical protein
MPEARPHPLGILAGLAFFALTLIGFAVGGETPGIGDSPQEVVNFYRDHHDAQMWATFLVAFGTPFLGIFVAHLWAMLRAAGAPWAWTTLVAIGGSVAIAGFLLLAGVHLSITEAADKNYSPQSLRALHALDNDLFFPAAGGVALMMIGAGVSLMRSALLPRWLGIVALVIGILGFTPAGFFAFLAAGLWIAIVSVVGFRVLSRGAAAAAPPSPGVAV